MELDIAETPVTQTIAEGATCGPTLIEHVRYLQDSFKSWLCTCLLTSRQHEAGLLPHTLHLIVVDGFAKPGYEDREVRLA